MKKKVVKALKSTAKVVMNFVRCPEGQECHLKNTYLEHRECGRAVMDLIKAGAHIVNIASECQTGKTGATAVVIHQWLELQQRRLTPAEFRHVKVIVVSAINIRATKDSLQEKYSEQYGLDVEVLYIPNMKSKLKGRKRAPGLRKTLDRDVPTLIIFDECHWWLSAHGGFAGLMGVYDVMYTEESIAKNAPNLTVVGSSATGFPAEYANFPTVWLKPGTGHRSWASLQKRIVDVTLLNEEQLVKDYTNNLIQYCKERGPRYAIVRLPYHHPERAEMIVKNVVEIMHQNLGPRSRDWDMAFFVSNASGHLEKTINSLAIMLEDEPYRPFIAFVKQAGMASQTWAMKNVGPSWQGPFLYEERDEKKDDTYTQQMGRFQGYESENPSEDFPIYASMSHWKRMDVYYDAKHAGEPTPPRSGTWAGVNEGEHKHEWWMKPVRFEYVSRPYKRGDGRSSKGQISADYYAFAFECLKNGVARSPYGSGRARDMQYCLTGLAGESKFFTRESSIVARDALLDLIVSKKCAVPVDLLEWVRNPAVGFWRLHCETFSVPKRGGLQGIRAGTIHENEFKNGIDTPDVE